MSPSVVDCIVVNCVVINCDVVVVVVVTSIAVVSSDNKSDQHLRYDLTDTVGVLENQVLSTFDGVDD